MSMKALFFSNLSFSVDCFYFLDHPTLIATHIIITKYNIKLGTANFISLAVSPYQNICAAEIYRALEIFKLIE